MGTDQTAKRVAGPVMSLLVIAAVMLLSACSSSGGHTASPTTTAPSQPSAQSTGTAKITSFVVPAQVKCGSGTSTTVPVSYSVTGARTRQIVVDGLAEPGPEPVSGHLTVRVHCDGLEHTVALDATDGKGGRTSQVKYLVTQVPPG